MIESPVQRPGPAIPAPGPADWSAALLTSSSEALLGAVRNYIGPVKTPFDKRDLVAKLEAFLKRPETRESLFSLLDGLDCKILGSSLLVGPVSEQSLKELFLGEIPLFELGVRLSNLLDRLLLFRYQVAGRRYVAVNPLLEEELRGMVLGPAALFGSLPGAAAGAGAEPAAAAAQPVDAAAAVALFSFLFHAPASMRKAGGLTKRAAERVAVLFPELSSGAVDRPGLLARALSRVGVLPESEEEGRAPNREAFAALLAEWGEELPYYLAASLAGDFEEGQSSSSAPDEAGEGRLVALGAARECALALAGALEGLPSGCEIARPAMARWLRIVARRARLAPVPAGAVGALEAFGLVSRKGGGLIQSLPRREGEARGAAGKGVLVVEGTHALHLMPEASLEERLFVGCLARPSAIGKVWSFELDRDTVRRAFASGLSAAEIKSRFIALSGTELPQSFTFSLAAWEEEYRSLRLYRGFVLVADERQRPIIERSSALGRLVAERLGPGVYFLAAASADEAAAALSAAGLEAPPVILGAAAPLGGAAEAFARAGSGAAGLGAAGSAARGRIDAIGELVSLAGEAAAGAGLPDPERRLAVLRKSLSSSSRGEEARRELGDRIERRLVLTERQIAESDPHAERLEASGLDYQGKIRVVERALRSSGDRLEVLYRLPGEAPVRALLRPVRLDKNEKGLVLEAEDLGSGGPVRVALGAVSTVRRLRASLFGEEQ